MQVNQPEVNVAEGAYEVVSIALDSYDEVAARLQEALNERARDGYELISCFPAVAHFDGELHHIPLASEGTKPYDEVWRAPTGPSFIAIFRR